jgi:phage I-like protein
MSLIASVLASSPNGAPAAIVWMPVGTHTLSAGTVDGSTFTGEVICDEQAFEAIKASFDELVASGQRVWLDEDHSDGAATAWVKDFAWSPSLGIIAHIEWTPRGEAALRNKDFYSFSPAFKANRNTGRVVSLVKGHAAGGLVNSPAFSAMPAVIAAKFNDDGSPKSAIATAGLQQLGEIVEIAAEMSASLDPDDPDFDEQTEALNGVCAELRKNPIYAAIASTL